jgi:curved DNA-binding protein CbpA
MTDPYLVLGASPTATQAEITHAYRRHLRDHHPDIRSRESNSEADERLRQVLEAYALLRDLRRVSPTTALIPPTKTPVRSRYQ